MSLEIKGKFVKALEPVTGQGQNGEWKKQDFVITTEDQYPKDVCFTVWGDKTDYLTNYKPNDVLVVSFNPESREYKGRYFTNLQAWFIKKDGENTTSSNNTQPNNQVEEQGADLPF